MAAALAGIRVVECATGIAGPYCGKLFAGLGGEVLKIEPPGGDPSRLEGPFPADRPDTDCSGLFLHLNTGKRSAVLDLGVDGGPEQLERVLRSEAADVLLLSHRPVDLAAIGLDLDELRRRIPALVVVNVTTFGSTGPYANYVGGELVAYAVSGYMNLTGQPDREPIKAYGSLVEYQAGAQAAVGTMAALFARAHSGEGQVVDVSAMEAGTFLLGGVEQQAYFHGAIVRRNGTRLLGFGPELFYPSTIRPCQDGYVHCHNNNRHPDLLGALIQHPRLLEPDLLQTMTGHADEIDAIIDDWLKERTRAEVVELAQELRLPFTEVLTPGEVLADRHNIERGSFASVEHPKAGPIRQPGSPFRMHATPWETKPAPVLGQHTEQVVARSRSVAPTSARTPRPRPARGRPLQGFRVVDFTTAVAGPLASSILGSLGAEVIKVESPYGRPLRPVGTAPAREGADERAYNRMTFFNAMNHGKRGISLDVSRPEGRDLFLRLAAASDVVLQNFSPRVSRNLGIEYEDLKRVRQDIVLVSMPAFGLTGPYRDRGSYGPGIDAMSGLSHLTGYADGPPLKPGNFYCDQNAGVHASFATMAALWHRRITGQGQHVELPMLEGEFQMLGDAYIDFDMNGRDRSRPGNDHPWMAPHNVFRCAGEDSWVAIAVENDSQWRALCDAIGRPSLARSESYAGAKARHRNRRELDAIVDAWTANQGHLAVQDALQQRGIPAAAVLNAGQLLVNEHVVARHGFEYVDVPGVGPTPYPRPAFVLDPPTPIEQAAPQFAEANDYVYGDLLRLTPDELSRLEASAVISREPLRR